MTGSFSIPDSSGDNDTPVQKIVKLLRNVSDEELADIHVQVVEEQKRRLDEAEKKLANLKETFGHVESRHTHSTAPKSTVNNPDIKIKHKQSKQNKIHKTSRAPRGKSKDMILAFLADGPKGRKQIEAHFAQNGLAATSVATLLNRLKKDYLVDHDMENQQYMKTPTCVDVRTPDSL